MDGITFSAESVFHVQGYGQSEASHTSYAKGLAIRPLVVRSTTAHACFYRSNGASDPQRHGR